MYAEGNQRKHGLAVLAITDTSTTLAHQCHASAHGTLCADVTALVADSRMSAAIITVVWKGSRRARVGAIGHARPLDGPPGHGEGPTDRNMKIYVLALVYVRYDKNC
ncbi:hypothetical protein EVAR_54240_1 [Eumeta japonica]|uniref:Uncharacterized protein n=1 Tax=Eumeta variegata TaxID=151549 RepID=A0A4C1YFT0_EUMVA|nr:hypothetical protein EVAR_54240_1 [Eumeta japonica]